MSKTTDIHAELDRRGALPASKPPEWPEEPKRGEGSVSVSLEHVAAVQAVWLDYESHLAEAALARMEDLMEYARHYSACQSLLYGRSFGCTCGLSDLLAACARKEAGR